MILAQTKRKTHRQFDTKKEEEDKIRHKINLYLYA